MYIQYSYEFVYKLYSCVLVYFGICVSNCAVFCIIGTDLQNLPSTLPAHCIDVELVLPNAETITATVNPVENAESPDKSLMDGEDDDDDDGDDDYGHFPRPNTSSTKVSVPTTPLATTVPSRPTKKRKVTHQDIQQMQLDVLSVEKRKIEVEVDNLMLARQKLQLEVDELLAKKQSFG